ncbi:hypothetical protein EDB92DRAFT_230161 [Lactarius akahatsu]|uniref:Uncharacterized protein n=1 Tax=Lactarius akahatsu TaxID=416441 RepID=A0AAD4LK31_9AGAM|nr:hypothetical protein EDB92DRAFT_230161 [Lactarius akahatsu]
MQPENIIIRRRRKRWPPTEPRLDESYTVPPDTILPNLPVLEFPSSSPNTGFTPRGPLTLEDLGQTGELREENPADSEACSPSMPAPQATNTSHEGQSITVHQFLQDMTKKPCRKYGRRNRFAAVEPGDFRNEGPSPSSISCSDEPDGQSDGDQGTSTPHRAHHVQLRHPSRVPRRRQRLFTKPLAQRLLEADVYSTGTFSRPTAQDSVHTPARRPLHFITSLNLTPSLETRIYKRRQVVAGGSSSTRNDSPGVTLARGRAPDRNTLDTRGGGSGAILSSGKRMLRTRGRKQGLARSSAGPFEFVPLPLVRVITHQGAVLPHSGPSAYTKCQSEFSSSGPTTRPLAI